MKTPKKVIFIVIFAVCLSSGPASAFAANPAKDLSLILRGTVKTLGAVLSIPHSMLVHSTKTMFPFGLVTGAVAGSFRAIGGTMSGAFDLARGAAPYAKYMVFV